MEVEYALDESDLATLSRFQVNRSSIIRRRFQLRWLGCIFGFGLMGPGTYLAFSSTTLLLAFGSLAVLSGIIYPFYFRWAGERRIHQIVRERATPSTFTKRKLLATPEGLEQVMENSESKVNWKLVDEIAITDSHAFISIDGDFSIVIPKRRLGESQFHDFLDIIRQYVKTSAA